jgi:succinate dehydrogenase hydrophobic anchor subunit
MARPRSVPAWLAVVLALALVVTGVWATSVSDSTFGAYNPGWDGTSELRAEASDGAGPSPVVPRIAAFDGVSADGTVAIVLSPDEPYTDAEAARLRSFVRRGGTLVVTEDFGPHSDPLLRRIGASTRVDGRLVRDERHYAQSPNLTVATGVTESPLTDGVDRLTLNHGTALRPNGARVLVETSRFAYVDANGNASLDASESMRQYPVVTVEQLGEGRAVVVGDPSLFINAMLDAPDNRRFVRTLFAAHTTVLLDYSHSDRLPPLVAARLALERSAWLQSLVGLVLLGFVLLASVRLRTIGSRRSSADVPPPSRERLRRGLTRHRSDRDAEWLPRPVTGIITEAKKGGDGISDDGQGGDDG